jgi:formamidopyrimidine-DNA glycosylase
VPELPEVETVARGLQASVAGRRVLRVMLRKTDFIDDPALLERELPGRRIERIARYGKFMLLELDEATPAAGGEESPGSPRGAALLVHLGMTGNLAPHFADQPPEKHTHVSLLLDDGRELRYTDARRFGRMAYLAGETLAAELRRFGADPLAVSREEFAARIETSRARIKALLLDQTVLRGVGNIYADESLWRARIHPATPGSRLNPQQTERLRKALKAILLRAIEMRGSTISDFVDSNGESGEYQQHHRAYGREGRKCYRCGARIERVTLAGRSSHFCPGCQPAPGVRRRKKTTKRKRLGISSKR